MEIVWIITNNLLGNCLKIIPQSFENLISTRGFFKAIYILHEPLLQWSMHTLTFQINEFTLMPVYHCRKPVFRPKNDNFLEGGNEEGRVATPTSFSIFNFHDIESL